MVKSRQKLARTLRYVRVLLFLEIIFVRGRSGASARSHLRLPQSFERAHVTRERLGRFARCSAALCRPCCTAWRAVSRRARYASSLPGFVSLDAPLEAKSELWSVRRISPLKRRAKAPVLQNAARFGDGEQAASRHGSGAAARATAACWSGETGLLSAISLSEARSS